MKKGFRIKTLSIEVASCIVILVGFVLLSRAVSYQQRLAAHKEFLSKMAGKSMPREVYHFFDGMQTTISLLTTIGIMFCIIGGFFLFLPRKMISFLLLTLILFSNIPIIAHGTISLTEETTHSKSVSVSTFTMSKLNSG